MKSKGLLKLFIKYVSLNVMGMAGLSCYILADTYFVAQGLGANGLAALNLAIPIYSFIHGSGLMFGMGGATKYVILKSRGEREQANRVFTNTTVATACLAAFFFAAGLMIPGPITRMLGADSAVFQMSKTYLQMILLFAPMFMLNNLLLCFVRNDGAPQLSMAAMIGGSLSNVVLDYIFIFPFKMGIFGAVLATGLAPVISILILSPYFLKRKNQFRLVNGAVSVSQVGTVMSLGFPSLITEASSGMVMIIFNTIILRLEGNTGVAAYGIIANLSLVVIAIYTGVAQGIQPLLSSSYGAGNQLEIRTILRYALRLTLIISSVVYFTVFLGASGIAAMFDSEQNKVLQDIAVTGLRIYFTAGLFAGFNIMISVFFASTERTVPAHIISMLRGFAVTIPMAFLLSYLAGIIGIWWVFPAAELIVSGIACGLFCVSQKRILLKNRTGYQGQDEAKCD